METECVMVFTTIGSGVDARALASILVTERLAACVNVFGEMESVYRWKGAIET
jgi:periplasmic divalent cation tolerance protein